MQITDWPWQPDPDYTRAIKALRRQGDPNSVPFVELYADPEFVAAVLDEPVILYKLQEGDREAKQAVLDQKIRFCYRMGYDVIWQKPDYDLPGVLSIETEDTAALTRGTRSWINQQANVITNWEEFERYPWPKPEDADYTPLEYHIKHLPEGMAIMADIRGIHEPLMFLMGFEALAFAIYDQLDLVDAIIDKLIEILLPVVQTLAHMDRVVALFMGDDMGFKTGTFLSPDLLRKLVFPAQKIFVDIAYQQGIPLILHSCGKLEAIMDELIEVVEVDAKHSYEDVIEPVESFSEKYHDRISILGGIDIDLLARGTEQQVRGRTREVLFSCASSKGYMLGSGNSLANYLSVENYLAMLDEGWCFNTGTYNDLVFCENG